MKLAKAAKIWIDYHKAHSKKNSQNIPGKGGIKMRTITLPQTD